jgi:choline dehydrogenase-like flavoprotein
VKPQRDSMRRYDGAVDVCIVGCGAGGSTLAKELSEAGLSVVVLEAGRWLDTTEDFINDELEMRHVMDWDDVRISDGDNPIQIGHANTGRAVGGSTVHFTAMKLRLHPDDFALYSNEGIAVDWPITYEELEPYYERAEDFVGVSGPRSTPWPGNRSTYPQGELPLNAGDEVIAEGLEKLGIQWCMTPHAVLTGEKNGRSPCMFYGFCIQGCKSDAKGSALVTWVPAAVEAGAEIRENAFAYRINVDSHGRARSVSYFQNGHEREQPASIVIVACYSIETPRLLLNSACPQFPDGLANSSGMVGKNLMVHPASIAHGRFAEPLDNFVTPPVGIMTQDPYGTQPGRDYVRGFLCNRYSHFPIEFITSLIKDNPDIWGARLHEVMDKYTHWTLWTSQNEMLPRMTNEVRLSEQVKDEHGIPVAHVTMSYDDNDKRMLADTDRYTHAVMEAAGAEEILMAHADYHLLGTCRMGDDPMSSVVDQYCRSHDIPNLFICDGSVFPTIGAVNPSLTIEALALRTAEHIATARE